MPELGVWSPGKTSAVGKITDCIHLGVLCPGRSPAETEDDMLLGSAWDT